MVAGSIWQRALRAAMVLAAVGLITGFYRAIEFHNATTIAMSFLLLVLAVAARWGLTEAIVASLTSTLCFNYFFLPPVGTWTIAEPANWVALIAFLVVSTVASQLSERARRKAQEAIDQRQETERLYALSRMILMLTGRPEQVAGEIARQIQQVFQADSVALLHRESGQIYHAGGEAAPLSDSEMKEIALHGNLVERAEGRLVALPVSLGGKNMGSLSVSGVALSDGARQAVANLIAIALEAARSRELASRAEMARQSEEFKSTLLDALAHELKTPLTSIKASVTALLDNHSPAPHDRQELHSIIAEETDRLAHLVTEALRMARIEAGKLKLDRRACAIEPLIQQAVEGSERLLEGREVQARLAGDLPEVLADAELIDTVVRHLLDNAAKYSKRGAPIQVRAEAEPQQVHVTVADQGPGLEEEELSHVFERYYRGARSRDTVPGVGMGLHIAREIILAHGGRMWAESSPGQGARFHFTLPLAEVRSHA